MPQKHEFVPTLSKDGDGVNANFFIEVPPEIVADFGKKGQVKFKVTIESFAYHHTVISNPKVSNPWIDKNGAYER